MSGTKGGAILACCKGQRQPGNHGEKHKGIFFLLGSEKTFSHGTIALIKNAPHPTSMYREWPRIPNLSRTICIIRTTCQDRVKREWKSTRVYLSRSLEWFTLHFHTGRGCLPYRHVEPTCSRAQGFQLVSWWNWIGIPIRYGFHRMEVGLCSAPRHSMKWVAQPFGNSISYLSSWCFLFDDELNAQSRSTVCEHVSQSLHVYPRNVGVGWERDSIYLT